MVTVQLKRKEIDIDIKNLKRHRNLMERVGEIVILTPSAEKTEEENKSVTIYRTMRKEFKKIELDSQGEVENAFGEV